ncbi:MAG TPA: flagellin, partial [Rubrivivax sp.]|nr:flagellin [Rubrivivax sp.]
GISLAQTAEGALGKVGDMLQRMRELAVQSSNATNSATDRVALQAEVGQLKQEIQRVADTTQFNGTKLLDGSFVDKALQVGANAGETISLASVADVNLVALGSLQTAADTYTQTLAPATATAFATGMSIDINGVTISTADGAADAPAAAAALKAAFDTAKANPANTALANVTMADDGAITSTDATLTLANLTNVSGVSAGTTSGDVSPGASETGITNLTSADAETATFAHSAIDSALTAVNEARGTLGAVQSRFESVIGNIAVTAENLSAARGRIMDADFAAETASMSRAQILQQAGTAMVAQANQLPQQVLQLLQR